MSLIDLSHARPPAELVRLQRHAPEIVQLEKMLPQLSLHGRIDVTTRINYKGIELPVYALEFGPNDPSTPVFVMVGGVHGLERIGTRIILEYLKTFNELLYWDSLLSHFLTQCRILFYPIVNPAGIYGKTRSNGAGVDLMRNAPIDADHKPKVGLVCGHRISPKLPWYRGQLGDAMQPEAQALCDHLRARMFPSRFAMALDLHSGFGRVDRLWFPYAYSKKRFPHYVEMFALKRKLDQALPNHVYIVEPQSHQYVTHGDLWDFLYMNFSKENPTASFLPLTLEMGSWSWIRKNPKQLFGALGIFNPMLPHRTKRTLRRHINLIDFLMRLCVSYKRWSNPPPAKRASYDFGAQHLWYDQAHGS